MHGDLVMTYMDGVLSDSNSIIRAKAELAWHSVTIKGGYYALKYYIRQIIIFSILPSGHPNPTGTPILFFLSCAAAAALC